MPACEELWYARAMTPLPVVRTVTSGKRPEAPHRGGPAMPQLWNHPSIFEMWPERGSRYHSASQAG